MITKNNIILSTNYVSAIKNKGVTIIGYDLFKWFYGCIRLINWKTWTTIFSTTKIHSHLFSTEWLFDKHEISKIKVKSDPKKPNADEK